jgi:hypothetical protein
MHTSRVNRALLVTGILLAVLTAAMITIGSGTKSASAEDLPRVAAATNEGRKLCVYVENEGGWTEASIEKGVDRKYHAYVVAKIPSDGGTCPTVDASTFRWKVGPQPVKWGYCENFREDINPWPGKNVCDEISNNVITEFRVYDDGDGVSAVPWPQIALTP